MADKSSSPRLSAMLCSIGSPTTSISHDDLRNQVHEFLSLMGSRREVLILPPDFTRFYSQAGTIVRLISEYYKQQPSSEQPNIQILPALGTHAPMTQHQIQLMFGEELASQSNPSPFVVHNWREDVVTIGHAPAEMVAEATYGALTVPWPAQLNKLLWEKRIENHKNSDSLPPLIVSVGQVVPHEVMGMANFNKNIFVGVGGVEAINLSHFIGALHGMEKLMGRGKNPLRSILNYCSKMFLQSQFDMWYILTVIGENKSTGRSEMKGLYIGKDEQCYDLACDLSLQVNFNLLEKSPNKIVVYLNEAYHSTWLGNKAIYRTRMAIADGGELIVLAPWVDTFGEDGQIDQLIRKVGYIGTPKILQAMEQNPDLKKNLSAVAHLIHGSSEGRFTITYCPGRLSQDDIENVGYQYADLSVMMQKYDVSILKDGWNKHYLNGVEEEYYFISNPALGLWAVPSRFENSDVHEDTDHCHKVFVPPNDQNPIDMSGGVGGWKPSPT